MRLVRSVVEGAEPLVERHGAVGIIALEIAVVKIMGIGFRVEGRAIANHDAVEAGVTGRRRQAGMDDVIKRMERMGGNDPM